MTSPSTRPERPLISVVVEGYNESKELGTAAHTIEALKDQDFPIEAVEVLLLGSAAQAKAWAAELSQESGFWSLRPIGVDGLTYLELKNHGASLALGDIVAYTDSDVNPHRGWLSAIAAAMESGADVSCGLSLFKSASSWEWNSASRLAAASITWGWVVSRDQAAGSRALNANGFMDHNVAIRRDVLRKLGYNRPGRLCGAPLFARALRDSGAKLVLQPAQRVTHSFTWSYWLRSLHFRYGYEIFMLRRLDPKYPNPWIARTGALEPLVTMAWHIVLDTPRWFRVSRLLGLPSHRRLAGLPVVLTLSVIAHAAECVGMYWTLVDSESARKWAESV